MKRIMLSLIFIIFVTVLSAQKKEICFIKTALGDITIELYLSKAPLTVANFLKYVDANLYNNSSFFRAVTLNNQPKDSGKIEVIQGRNVDSAKEFATIPLETTKQTGLLHKDGTISMARGKPATATCSFFICINDQPSLDFGGKRNPDGQGFAAYGKVIKGMDIVKKFNGYIPIRVNILNPKFLFCQSPENNNTCKNSFQDLSLL